MIATCAALLNERAAKLSAKGNAYMMTAQSLLGPLQMTLFQKICDKTSDLTSTEQSKVKKRLKSRLTEYRANPVSEDEISSSLFKRKNEGFQVGRPSTANSRRQVRQVPQTFQSRDQGKAPKDQYRSRSTERRRRRPYSNERSTSPKRRPYSKDRRPLTNRRVPPQQQQRDRTQGSSYNQGQNQQRGPKSYQGPRQQDRQNTRDKSPKLSPLELAMIKEYRKKSN